MVSLPSFAQNLFALHSVNSKITVQNKKAVTSKHQLSTTGIPYVYYTDDVDENLSVCDWPQTIYRIPSNSVGQFFKNIDKNHNFKSALITSKSQTNNMTNKQQVFNIADFKPSNITPPKPKGSGNIYTREQINLMISNKPKPTPPEPTAPSEDLAPNPSVRDEPGSGAAAAVFNKSLPFAT